MVFAIEQNDRLALAARILQKLSEIYPARSEPVLRNQAANMELYAYTEASDRSSYLQNVASTIKREQVNASTALYNPNDAPTGNTSSSATNPPSNTNAAARERRARPQSVANDVSAPHGRGRGGRPRSSSAVTNMSSASRMPAAGATNNVNNNNPNFANMGNANGGIMSAEMIINLQRQHQRNARQQHQQALAIRQQQQQALALQQARIRKHAIANNLSQTQIQTLIAANPLMFNPSGNANTTHPATTSAPTTHQQAHPGNRINKNQALEQQQTQNQQPAVRQVPRQNPAAVAQFPIVRQKLVSFFKNYKDDFNIIVARLPVFVQATDPSKRDLVKKRLKAAHALFEAIRSNRVPLSVTEDLVDGHSNFMSMVIRWFKQTHPNIFPNRNNANNPLNASNANQQPQRAAQANANVAAAATAANRAKIQNVQNNAAAQHARATAVSQAAAHAQQAKATEQARLLQRQHVARAQLEARRVQQLAAQQAKAAVAQQPAPQAARAAVRSNVAPVITAKANATAAAVQVPRHQAPTNAQKKLPVGNRHGSPPGIAKHRQANAKTMPGTTGTVARGVHKKITKEQYLANLEKRVSLIFNVCEKIQKNANEQAIAVEKAAEDMKRKRARYSILSLQKFMKETRDATYGKDTERTTNSLAGDEMMQADKNFVCTGEGDLYLSEKTKSGKGRRSHTRELCNVREVVIADCNAARGRNSSIGMEIDISEEYGLPVVTCQLLIVEMKMPKLIIRVQRGYPTISALTYRLATPVLGWKGRLERIRNEFRKRIHKNSPVQSGMGVAGMLDTWANVAATMVEKEGQTEGMEMRMEADIDMGIMA